MTSTPLQDFIDSVEGHKEEKSILRYHLALCLCTLNVLRRGEYSEQVKKILIEQCFDAMGLEIEG